MNEPKKQNFRLFNQALKIASEILEETNFNPSIKQQGTIFRLLASNIGTIYARTNKRNSDIRERDIRDS